jgi:hypothetical protein
MSVREGCSAVRCVGSATLDPYPSPLLQELPPLALDAIWQRLGSCPTARSSFLRVSRGLRAALAHCVSAASVRLTRDAKQSRASAHARRLPPGLSLQVLIIRQQGGSGWRQWQQQRQDGAVLPPSIPPLPESCGSKTRAAPASTLVSHTEGEKEAAAWEASLVAFLVEGASWPLLAPTALSSHCGEPPLRDVRALPWTAAHTLCLQVRLAERGVGNGQEGGVFEA